MDISFEPLHQAISAFKPAIALGVFLAYLIVDALYAYYTLAVTQARPAVAATTGAVMHFLLALGVLSYVQNYLYIIPIAIGSWVGTYLVVRHEQENRNLSSPKV